MAAPSSRPLPRESPGSFARWCSSGPWATRRTYARRLFERIGRRHELSKMIELDGGHMVHFAQPDVVHGIIGQWLDELV